MSSVLGSRRAHSPDTKATASSSRLLVAARTQSAVRMQRQTRRPPNASSARRGNSAVKSEASVAKLAAPLAPAHGLQAEIQRNRILSAAIRSLEQVGYADTSVTQITGRARVSRRTFYELFAGRDECLLAVFEDTIALIERDLAAAALDDLPWPKRVRMGLWTILCFFEREPTLARVCVVQSLQADTKLLQRREALLAQLAAVLDEGRAEGARALQATPLTAEGLVGAALTIVYSRLLRPRHEPLTTLLGELMGLIVLPYLGAAAARREREHPLPEPLSGQDGDGARLEGDPFEGISIRLTYRTMRVLECVAAQPGASNRQVGLLAGVPDQGQISKLLSRLERLGLLVNAGKQRAKGEANAWKLTDTGGQVVQVMGIGRGVGA
jgi:AcrR family transcriptional regulator